MSVIGGNGVRVRAAVADTLAAATGQAERHDPVGQRTGGPAGNARLTAWVGLVLLVLFIAELLTLVDVRGFIDWHVAIGAVLVPPALAKTATTGWRIVRYYSGNPDYGRAGPPPLLLRVLGPLVVVGTLGVLATGIWLVVIGQDASRRQLVALLGFSISWVSVHQAAFLAWAVVTGLHLLARLLPAVRLVRGRSGSGMQVPGGLLRTAVLLLLAATAALAAVLLLHADASWHQDWWHLELPGRG